MQQLGLPSSPGSYSSNDDLFRKMALRELAMRELASRELGPCVLMRELAPRAFDELASF